MKICTDRDCPNKALRNSPRCMEHVKLAAGAGFPMRSYQLKMLEQMAAMRALMSELDERRAADNKRDRMRQWKAADMRGIAVHQTAVDWTRYVDRYGARGWFGLTPEYKVPEKRVKPGSGFDIREIRKLWK